MKYSTKQKDTIMKLHKAGVANREIARKLGISESGIRGLLKVMPSLSVAEKSTDGPKILLLDIETTAALVYAFGRHKQYINQDAVYREGGKIIMASVGWLDEGAEGIRVIAHPLELAQDKDEYVVTVLWHLIAQADAVIAHNGRAFDMKMLEARAIANGLTALPAVHIIDTLEIARKKFRFPSAKLDSLGAYLSLGRKEETGGIDLWVKVQQGDPDAFMQMIEYCKQDGVLLMQVYLALRSRGVVSAFNAANYYNDEEVRCKSCGSTDLSQTGRIVTTPTGKFAEIRCNDCGTVHRSKDNLNDKNKRKTLLAQA